MSLLACDERLIGIIKKKIIPFVARVWRRDDRPPFLKKKW
jgi:hypothetical protein